MVFLLGASAIVRAAEQGERTRGDPERGRQVFHRIGGCSVCHGNEGHLNDRPPLSPKLKEAIDRLNPPPANLRNPAGLKSQNDQQRFLSIKFGHQGTAMFPKRFLRDDEIADVVAYLAVLRGEKVETNRAAP